MDDPDYGPKTCEYDDHECREKGGPKDSDDSNGSSSSESDSESNSDSH